jgi:ABC-type multidrug transport system permease subunit
VAYSQRSIAQFTQAKNRSTKWKRFVASEKKYYARFFAATFLAGFFAATFLAGFFAATFFFAAIKFVVVVN